MRAEKIDLVIMAATLLGYAALAGPALPAGRFSYDEADYMYAVSKGFAANYLDRPTIPFTTFVKKGVEEGMRRQSTRHSLSEYIRSTDDIAFYRHFHGPLYFYWLLLHAKLLGIEEQTIRWASLTSLLLAYVAVYLGCLAVVPRGPRITAVLASTMLLVSPASIATTRLITPHGMYVVTAILALVAMARLVDTGSIRYWYYSLAATTLALLTIEFAPLLVVTLAICAFVRRSALFGELDRRGLATLLGQSTLLVVSVIVVAWPAGLFKLTFVKNYLFFTYVALAGARSISVPRMLTAMFDRITASPVQFGVVIACVLLGLYLLKRRQVDAWILPFAVYGVLMLLASALPASPEPTHASSLFAALAVIAGASVAVVLARARPVFRGAATAAIVAVLAISGVTRLRSPSNAVHLSDLIVEILPRGETPPERVAIPRVLLPTVHYYFPGVSTVVYSTSVTCGGVHALALSHELDGIVCTGAGQDSAHRELARDHDVQVHRLGSPEKGRELVYYRLKKLERR
ncbi:MAG TPA: glycosyltransferase family 39 protein [Gemmatimonadaceae bacterium]|nr:glycosyltransferase family 39 protein [Gemmatimonadaceae bacterium]